MKLMEFFKKLFDEGKIEKKMVGKRSEVNFIEFVWDKSILGNAKYQKKSFCMYRT